jgi:hypothetical protein
VSQEVAVSHQAHDPETLTAVVHGISTAEKMAVEGMKWEMEFVLMFTFEKSGSKVKRIAEVMDSAYFLEGLKKLSEAGLVPES